LESQNAHVGTIVEKCRIQYEHLNLTKHLGSGAFSDVWKGKNSNLKKKNHKKKKKNVTMIMMKKTKGI